MVCSFAHYRTSNSQLNVRFKLNQLVEEFQQGRRESSIVSVGTVESLPMEGYQATEYRVSNTSSDQALQSRSRSISPQASALSLPVVGRGPSSQLRLLSPTLPSSAEVSVCCERCGKVNIAYDLHMYCDQCNDGEYVLCLRCWRHGRGCLNWYGFGQSAMTFHAVSSKAIDYIF